MNEPTKKKILMFTIYHTVFIQKEVQVSKKNTSTQRMMKAFFTALLVAVIASAFKLFLPTLLPYGTSQPNFDRAVFAKVDSNLKTFRCSPKKGDIENSNGGNLVKIYERIGEGKTAVLDGPETIVLDDESNIYALAKGNIIKLTNLGPGTSSGDSGAILADTTVVAKTVGFPLGGKFVSGTKIMYFADAVLGLCRIDLSKENPKVELIASQFELDDGTISKINYADDVDIGSKSGMVYFSDATDIVSEQEGKTWDVLHGYLLDFMRSKRTGRLLRYDPVRNKVEVLASNIWFANGVAVNEEETFLMISETSMGRLLKFNLVGPDQGKLEILVDGLPGFVDGADCSKAYCYAPLPSSCPPIVRLLNSLPPSIEAWLKTLMMMLPKAVSPKATKYGGVVEVTVGDESSSGGSITRFFQDPSGECIHGITGVTSHDGKLYLGSLENNFIGVLDLDAPFDESPPFLIFSNETAQQ